MKSKPALMCFLFFFFFLAASGELFAYIKLWNIPLGSEKRQEINIELDHYYSCLSYTVGITEQPIPEMNITREGELYWYMLRNFIFPRYVLFEASLYPLPIAGVYIKKEARNFYNASEVVRGFNIVKAATEGFSEPYAGSVFFGNVANFTMGDSDEVTGRGFSGFAVSCGDRHIVDNIMVADKWCEVELKIKGMDEHQVHNMEWSYSVGIKLHDNNEIKHRFFISIYRNRIYYADNMSSLIGFLRNTEQQLRIDFDLKNFDIKRLTSFSFLMGKNFPIGDGTVTLALRAGTLKIFSNGYSGSLKQAINSKWTPIIRPMAYLKF
ncbi:MAG: AsmA family protein [Leptospirales bacterium]|nr:AsmA family protein [Leptospirales bacterium]